MNFTDMTDADIRRELKDTAKDSQRYSDLMSELEERMILRNSRRTAASADMLPHSSGWHSSTDRCEGM